MKQLKIYGNVAFLSTYPPRECGVAIFTEDLVTTMDHNDALTTRVIAMNDGQSYVYDDKVMAEIRQNEKTDYLDVAKKLNESDIDLLVIEHDFDFFGGDEGEYVLDLVNALEIPIVTTLHTIYLEPNSKQKFILNALGKKSKKIVTMANNTIEILQSTYGIDVDKIIMINHGVSKKPLQARDILKAKMGYENKQIITTFGMIGPGKGIENGIEAIAKVIYDREHAQVIKPGQKDLLYLILGQTHPSLKDSGDAYRNKLIELVEGLQMGRNVKFVNKYLSKEEIIQYLQVSDIYMTPYLEKDQAVSGPLAYAVGYGKAIVSTPYLYAQEMLSEGNGLLAEYNNPDSIADCITQILKDPFKQKMMERNTAKIGRKMYWDKVAQQYRTMILDLIVAERPVEEESTES